MTARKKILLCDCEPTILDCCEEMLAQLSSQPEVRKADSGPQTLAMLEAEPFDLLICELVMPKMDGFQVLAIVRNKYPQLRTIAWTAEIGEWFRSAAYALGVGLFCNKPPDVEMLLEQVESLLAWKGGGRSFS